MTYYKATLGNTELMILADNEDEVKSKFFCQYFFLPETIQPDTKATTRYQKLQYRRKYFRQLKRRIDFILLFLCIIIGAFVLLVGWIQFETNGAHNSPWQK